MQIAQAKLVGFVDQHRVRVGNVDAAFNDRGGHEHVVCPVDEARHDILELLAFHLAMANAHPRVRHQTLDHSCHLLDVPHAVVHEVGLPSAA